MINVNKGMQIFHFHGIFNGRCLVQQDKQTCVHCVILINRYLQLKFNPSIFIKQYIL